MLIAVTAHIQAQSQTPVTGGLSLAGAIERALAGNPSIAAARLQRPIDQAGVGIAGERPNPELAYELSKETPRQAITATLPIELGGKRGRRLDVANATLAVGEAELAAESSKQAVGTIHALAYVDVNAKDDSMQFAELVARNRSAPVRVFGTVAEAEIWIGGEKAKEQVH